MKWFHAAIAAATLALAAPLSWSQEFDRSLLAGSWKNSSRRRIKQSSRASTALS